MTPILSLWPNAATGMLATKTGSLLKEPAGSYAGLYDSISCDGMQARELAETVSDKFRSLIRLTMADTTLHIVCVMPLFTTGFSERLTTITGACALCTDKVSLHIIGLRRAFTRVLGIEPGSDDAATEAANITLLNEAARHGRFQFSHTLIDDYAANGAPLDFTLHSFSDYLALLFAALMRDYHAILPPAMLSSANGEPVAVGISSLRFDRDHVCGMLLHRAFLDSLDRVGINQSTVDAQKASDRASRLLHGIEKRYTAFYDKNVIPQFRDEKKSESEIVGEIAAPLDDEFNDIERQLTGFLHDRNIPFPEKEGILALLLGRDNHRLSGIQYDRETLLLDDACSVPVNLYIKAFNIDPTSAALPQRGEYPALKKYIWNFDTEAFEDSSENQLAFDPLPELKRLKLEILNTTAFIRKKSDELNELTLAETRRQQAEKDSVQPACNSGYQPFDKEIREQPLAETYHPDVSVRPKPSVDLRQFFSPVRNQGNLGACSTFAVVSMYEAIMNRFSGNSNKADMSERFVYYYSNVLTGQPEGGSNYFDQLGVLGKHGVCSENIYGYSTANLDIKPSDTAIDEAMNHRVLMARQIQLRSEGDKSECLTENHRLLTSALSEGYPVGISLKIYPDFGKHGAFINRPDQNDISAGKEGFHAMVLAGYSEAEKCYIVRNSWGPKWGDKGYCYISAAYIDDPDYNNFACIITETTDSEQRQGAEIPPLVAGFGGTETEIRIAAIRNVLDEAYIILDSRRKMYDENYKYYQHLMQRLAMPQNRNIIRKMAEDKSAERLLAIASEHNRLNNSFISNLKEFKRAYINAALILTLITVIFCTLTVWLVWPPQVSWSWWISSSLAVTTVYTWLHYYWAVRKKRRELNEELARLAHREHLASRDLLEKQLQFHVAGMWIDRFQKLSIDLGKTYDRLISYNGHLRSWYEEDSHLIATPPRREGSMFVYLTPPPDLLDRCYARKRDDILHNIDLMDTFERYTVERESITESRNRLKENTLAAIRPIFSDFNMAEYMAGQEYPYLTKINLSDEIDRLLSVGQPSSRSTGTMPATPSRLIFIDIPDTRRQSWLNVISPYFPMTPSVISTESSCNCDIISCALYKE